MDRQPEQTGLPRSESEKKRREEALRKEEETTKTPQEGEGEGEHRTTMGEKFEEAKEKLQSVGEAIKKKVMGTTEEPPKD